MGSHRTDPPSSDSRSSPRSSSTIAVARDGAAEAPARLSRTSPASDPPVVPEPRAARRWRTRCCSTAVSAPPRWLGAELSRAGRAPWRGAAVPAVPARVLPGGRAVARPADRRPGAARVAAPRRTCRARRRAPGARSAMRLAPAASSASAPPPTSPTLQVRPLLDACAARRRTAARPSWCGGPRLPYCRGPSSPRQRPPRRRGRPRRPPPRSADRARPAACGAAGARSQRGDLRHESATPPGRTSPGDVLRAQDRIRGTRRSPAGGGGRRAPR